MRLIKGRRPNNANSRIRSVSSGVLHLVAVVVHTQPQLAVMSDGGAFWIGLVMLIGAFSIENGLLAIAKALLEFIESRKP